MMRLAKRFFFALSLSLVCGAASYGQRVETLVTRDSILVGDSLHVIMTVRAEKGADILFAEIPDTLGGGVELFAPPRIDTLRYDDSGYVSQLVVPISAYDSGDFVIPRIPALVLYNGVSDTLHSELHFLHVSLSPRDSLVADIMPIRGPIRQRITFREVLPWLLLALAILLLGVGIFYYVRRRKGREGLFSPPKPVLPPDVRALRALQELQQRKMWRNPGVKYFFTELTGALRLYMAEAWGIRTQEETTREILLQLPTVETCDPEMAQEIKHLLEQGDLVKFARFQPLENDCIDAVSTAIELVQKDAETLRRRAAEDAQGDREQETE